MSINIINYIYWGLTTGGIFSSGSHCVRRERPPPPPTRAWQIPTGRTGGIFSIPVITGRYIKTADIRYFRYFGIPIYRIDTGNKQIPDTGINIWNTTSPIYGRPFKSSAEHKHSRVKTHCSKPYHHHKATLQTALQWPFLFWQLYNIIYLKIFLP